MHYSNMYSDNFVADLFKIFGAKKQKVIFNFFKLIRKQGQKKGVKTLKKQKDC